VLPTPVGALGVAICFESIFPDHARAAVLDAKLGLGLRLVTDPKELAARLGGAAVWAPPKDDFAYLRVLASCMGRSLEELGSRLEQLGLRASAAAG